MARTPGEICRMIQDEITALGGEHYFAGVEKPGPRDLAQYQLSDRQPIIGGAQAVEYMEEKLREAKEQKEGNAQA